jgi:hypothetical protein
MREGSLTVDTEERIQLVKPLTTYLYYSWDKVDGETMIYTRTEHHNWRSVI